MVSSTDGSTTVNFKYDPLGRRVQKTIDTGTTAKTINFYYDGNQVIEERDGSDQVLKQYVYGNGIDEILRIDKYEGGTATPYYFHTNAIGSVTAVSDSDGTLVERVSYDTFGMPTFTDYLTDSQNPTVVNHSVIGNDILFQGRRYDKETNLYYYRARYYDPIMGRFLQTDPIGYRDSMNLYQAFNMNPVNIIDPMGLYGIDFHYYVIYFLFKAKGWDSKTSYTVAGFSQYVDDNSTTMPYPYDLDNSRIRFFHFPGSSPTTPVKRDNRFVRGKVRQYSKEFDANNLETMIRLGVFLHIYADSWAHEGFSAWWTSKINRRSGSLRPDWGHADAREGGHAPDLISLNKENYNKAIEASQKIFRLLPKGKEKVFAWEEIVPELRFAFHPMSVPQLRKKKLPKQVILKIKSVVRRLFKERMKDYDVEDFEKLSDQYIDALSVIGGID
jgi:RHS repeat-associated protein